MQEPEVPKVKNPKRVAQGLKLAKMDKKYFGGKAGPKVHKNVVEFFSYLLPRMEKERSNIDFLIQYYAKQPYFLRALISQSPEFEKILWALQADIGFNLYKPTREQWAALSGMFQRLAKIGGEKEKTKRKTVNKENAKSNKAGDSGMTGVVIETENENE